eukprot:106781_1
MIWWMIPITTSASTVATANTASPSYDMQHNELTLFFALYKARQKQWNIAIYIIRSSHVPIRTHRHLQHLLSLPRSLHDEHVLNNVANVDPMPDPGDTIQARQDL